MNTAHQQRHAISPRQIKAVHAAKGKSGMDQETYWAMLRSYGCRDRDCGDKLPPHPTSKDLTWRQAEELLGALNGTTPPPQPSPAGGGSPLASPRRGEVGEGQKRYADLDGRPGMASGAQCRMIAAMWAEVSRATTDEERERALWSFLRRIVRVDHFRFMKGWQVQAVVKAISEMKKAKEGAACG